MMKLTKIVYCLFTGPPYSSGNNYTGNQSGGPGTPGSYVQNGPGGPQNGDFTNNMLPMSPMNPTMSSMNSMNNNDIMNKPMNQGVPGQYPLSPPDNNSPHLRHPDQAMNNHIATSTNSSQSQANTNNISSNGTQSSQMPHTPQQQAPPTSQQNNSMGDDLNFDPTAIIGDDETGPSLEVSV